MNKIIKKLFLILPILLVVLSLSGCDMKGERQGRLQEFNLNGTKVSFVPPQEWECGVFPWKDVATRSSESLICAKEISADIMNKVGGDYIESKGSGPYYDEIVKNNFGEVFLLSPEDFSKEERRFTVDEEHFITDYSRSQFVTFGDKRFVATIITRGRKNASSIVLPREQKFIVMASILPEDQTATLEPTEKVRQILGTISIEEKN